MLLGYFIDTKWDQRYQGCRWKVQLTWFHTACSALIGKTKVIPSHWGTLLRVLFGLVRVISNKMTLQDDTSTTLVTDFSCKIQHSFFNSKLNDCLSIIYRLKSDRRHIMKHVVCTITTVDQPSSKVATHEVFFHVNSSLLDTISSQYHFSSGLPCNQALEVLPKKLHNVFCTCTGCNSFI